MCVCGQVEKTAGSALQGGDSTMRRDKTVKSSIETASLGLVQSYIDNISC